MLCPLTKTFEVRHSLGRRPHRLPSNHPRQEKWQHLESPQLQPRHHSITSNSLSQLALLRSLFSPNFSRQWQIMIRQDQNARQRTNPLPRAISRIASAWRSSSIVFRRSCATPFVISVSVISKMLTWLFLHASQQIVEKKKKKKKQRPDEMLPLKKTSTAHHRVPVKKTRKKKKHTDAMEKWCRKKTKRRTRRAN